ncbi:MAG: OadG family protein [Oscillospiraceae bacterium]|nr:OadG family protein [Oscillospiraceae bacterium]
MSFGDALIYSLLGMCVVFFALVLLMCIIKVMTAVGDRAATRSVPAPAGVAAGGIPAPDTSAPVVPLAMTAKLAPGAAGQLKLYDTDPRTAAMLMAIVADDLQVPLNELRFLSIREIKEENER